MSIPALLADVEADQEFSDLEQCGVTTGPAIHRAIDDVSGIHLTISANIARSSRTTPRTMRAATVFRQHRADIFAERRKAGGHEHPRSGAGNDRQNDGERDT